MNKRKQTHAHIHMLWSRLVSLEATSHLYSPNVPSSSFMGWISGSWCASSFSFTAECAHYYFASCWATPCWRQVVKSCKRAVTWIFSTFVPLDEAHDEEDQDEERDGTHQPDEPSLSGNVHLPVGCSWTHRRQTVSTGCHFYFRAAKTNKKKKSVGSVIFMLMNLKDAGTEIKWVKMGWGAVKMPQRKTKKPPTKSILWTS